MASDATRVETVARALWNALPATQCGWDGAPEEDRAVWRRLAAAAIAADPSPAEEAVELAQQILSMRVDLDIANAKVQRVEALAGRYRRMGATDVAAALRAALASPAPGCTCDRVDQPATYHFPGCPAVYPPLASPAPAPQVHDRYWLCGDDCTTDCGACKGKGPR